MVRGMTTPSHENQDTCPKALDEVAAITTRLLSELVTTAPPRDREVEAAKRKARSATRFGAAA
jgi:hypothetical protein